MTTTAADPQARLVEERIDQLLSEHPPASTPKKEFWAAQFDLGLAWVHFPEGYGGLGVSPRFQVMVNERLREAGASLENIMVNILGYGMGGPVIVAHGTEEQKQRFLKPLFVADEIWCQLFSEPGAGSDLASLATRAVRDGDEWVVNGQKVWTTLAHVAKRGMLVARFDPDLPKHQGLIYFIVDMESPGVEVRPLYQITGEAEFNEVYFTDVRIPDRDRVGEPGEGWRIALTTLMNERVAIGANVTPRGGGAIGRAVQAWQKAGIDDPAKLDELMKLWTEAEAIRLTNIRASQMRKRGTPGPEGSTPKLQWAELNKRIYEYCVDLLGPEGMLYPGGYEFARPDLAGTSREQPLQKAFLRSRANSIEGGTSEILRNILGERVLGLPPEPRVDKDLPWKQVPRS